MVKGPQRSFSPPPHISELGRTGDRTAAAFPQVAPHKDKVTSVTKRLLFHCRLQHRSPAAENGTLAPFQTAGNTKGIGQQFNLFHCSPGKVSPSGVQ